MLATVQTTMYPHNQPRAVATSILKESYYALVAWERVKIQVLSTISAEWISPLYHHNVNFKKILKEPSQTWNCLPLPKVQYLRKWYFRGSGKQM